MCLLQLLNYIMYGFFIALNRKTRNLQLATLSQNLPGIEPGTTCLKDLNPI